MADKGFRKRLLANPKEVMAEELSVLACKNVKLPENFEIRVVEECPNVAYLVLPAVPEAQDYNLTNAELDPDGGIPFYCTTVTCKPGMSC